jgi:hypothetical protein
VAECAAVGVDSGIAGGEDEIKACLVLRAGCALVPEEFLAWCEARLPYFAVPRYLEVLAELPRTPNNKIQKYLLRRGGVSAAWDRVKAGYQLAEEIRKAEAKRRRPAPPPGPQRERRGSSAVARDRTARGQRRVERVRWRARLDPGLAP